MGGHTGGARCQRDSHSSSDRSAPRPAANNYSDSSIPVEIDNFQSSTLISFVANYTSTSTAWRRHTDDTCRFVTILLAAWPACRRHLRGALLINFYVLVNGLVQWHSSLWETKLRATERHLPYGHIVTRHRWTRPALTPAQPSQTDR